MSIELLRRAAAKARENAAVATPGPWECFGDMLVWPSDKGPAANDPIAGISEAHLESAEHIASWHPDVARAVADLWDTLADTWHNHGAPPPGAVAACTSARIYLGEEA